MTKTVAGTYTVDGAALHATVRVVDVSTGSAEGRSSADGTTKDVDTVMLDLAEVIAGTLRALRLMLDGEGGSPRRGLPVKPGAWASTSRFAAPWRPRCRSWRTVSRTSR